jgi:O-methyltransferase domain/Dimerisation domain
MTVTQHKREQQDEQPAATLMRLVSGFQVSKAISVAAELGIADLLGDGPRSADELAETTGSHPRSLYRLLRALAAVSVFREDQEGRFALTPLSECLRSDAVGSVAPMAVFFGHPDYWQAWGDLRHSVQTGEYAFRHVHGMSPWEYRVRHPETGAVFDRAMTGLSRAGDNAALAAYDFGRFGSVVDVGGGQGAFLAALLAKQQGTQGVLFDQAHVVAQAQPVLEAAGVADRCRVEAGSFFESIPEGGDAYVMKHVLVDWEDDDALAILRTCRRAIGADKRMLVIEPIITQGHESAAAKLLDVAVLVSPGGKLRTRDELGTLFGATGFRLSSIYPTSAGEYVVEGIPA